MCDTYSIVYQHFLALNLNGYNIGLMQIQYFIELGFGSNKIVITGAI